MENLRKKVRVDLVRPDETNRIARLVASPYESFRTFENGLVAVHSKKISLTLNRPVYAGQSILDLSKYLMYDFWYNHIVATYGDRVNLLYTDTDSLLFEVRTEDIYADMLANKQYYDFSEYPKDHPCYDPSNAKVPGLFKDESSGRPISEVVAISSKMYSVVRGLLPCDAVKAGIKTELKKAKGVSTIIVKNDLTHDLYKESILQSKKFTGSQVMLRSKHHKIGMYEQTKTTITPIWTQKDIYWITG